MSSSTSDPSGGNGPPPKRRRHSSESEEEPEEEPEVRRASVDASTNGSASPVNYNVPLIPKDREGTQSFRNVFEQRYCSLPPFGQMVPPFFIGSLQEAMSEAFDKPIIADRSARLLALYINHDGAQERDALAPNIFCVEDAIEDVSSTSVIWPWDVTEKENQVKLMTWLIECDLYCVLTKLTSHLEELIDNEDKDRFPRLIFVEKEQEGFSIDDVLVQRESSLNVPLVIDVEER